MTERFHHFRRARPSEAGHSLVEASVAAAVFSFGVLALVPLFYRSTESTVTASRITQATALAESKLAELTALPYDSPLLATNTQHDEGTHNIGLDGREISTSAFGAHDGNFFRSWTVEEFKVNTTTVVTGDYKQIVMTANWWDLGAKRLRTVTITGGKALLK